MDGEKGGGETRGSFVLLARQRGGHGVGREWVR